MRNKKYFYKLKENEYEDEEGSPVEMYNIILSGFNKREQDLGYYLADLIIEYKHNEMDYDTPYIDYLENEGDDLYDAGSDSLFRFLWKYYKEGIYEAIDSEIADEEDFNNILLECKKICPTLNSKKWKNAFQEVSSNWNEEENPNEGFLNWTSIDDFKESYSYGKSLKDDIKRIMGKN